MSCFQILNESSLFPSCLFPKFSDCLFRSGMSSFIHELLRILPTAEKKKVEVDNFYFFIFKKKIGQMLVE